MNASETWIKEVARQSDCVQMTLIGRKLFATRSGPMATLIELLKAVSQHSAIGIKPFHDVFVSVSARLDGEPAVREFLQSGACPNTPGTKDVSPMHAACAAHLGLLMAHGGNVNATNAQRQTPLHTRCAQSPEGENLQAIQMLLQAGADPNARDLNWRTPLHELILQAIKVLRREGHMAAEGAIDIEAAEVVRLMAHHGADMDMIAPDGRNLIGWLQDFNGMYFFRETTRAILELGGRADARCGQLYRCADLALDRNDGRLLSAVIHNGLSPESDGADLLHQAVADGASACVALLLEAGWDPHALNSQSRGVLDVEPSARGVHEHTTDPCKQLVRAYIASRQARQAMGEIDSEKSRCASRLAA